jgi:hypothetical protein
LVDTSDRDTVDLERTGDKQETRIELLQEDNTLTTVTTSQKDQDGTRDNGTTERSSLGGLAADLGRRYILSGVEARGLLDRDGTLTTVLGTLDLNSLLGSSFLGRSSNGLLGTLVKSLLGVGGRAAETVDTGNKNRVSRSVSHCIRKLHLQ